MLKRLFVFLSTISVASPAFAGPWDDIIKYGYAVSGGPLTGSMGFAVCEQVDDDTTPSIGTPGCNVLLTSTNHAGPVSITRFDDAESGVEPVTSTLYEQIIWVVGRAATNQTTIADGANFRLKEIPWDSPATGDHSVIQFKATYLTSSITAVGDGGGGTSLNITSTAHGLVVGQTVTLSSMSIAAYDGTYVINSVADPNTFNVTQTYSATATGTWDAIRFDEMWRSGNVDDYLYQNLYVKEGNATDFTNAQMVVGHSDSGETTNANRTGVVGEAAADGTNQGVGIAGYGKTSSAQDGVGVMGVGLVNAGTDSTTAWAGQFTSTATHGSGANIGVLAGASGGATNYALRINEGDISTLQAINWLGLDNNGSSVSFDAAGKANILEIDTLDGAEGVKMSGYLTVGNALRITSSADGIWEMGVNAGTQGVQMNTAAVDGRLLLSDEVGGTISVQAGDGFRIDGSSYYNNQYLLLRSATTLVANTNSSGGTISFGPWAQSDTDTTAAVTLSSGNQTNAGAYPSGPVKVYSGSTNTAGSSGPIWLYSGPAGAGIADAGDLVFAVNGEPGTGTTLLTMDASEQSIAHNERTTKSAKLTTTDAADNTIASLILADGEVVSIEVTTVGRERDGSDRSTCHMQGLFYRQGAGAVKEGVITVISEIESDITWNCTISVSGNNVIITVNGNGDTVDWEVTFTYQILVSAV